jgi:urease accessory protein
MICEQILGKVHGDEFAGKKIDYVDFQWDEAFKRLHRKVSRGGIDVGINLDDSVLTRGLNQDDVLAVDGDTVIAVNIEECEAIEITVDNDDRGVIAKVCYEIGNRHASLFRGEDGKTFLTPFTGPMLTMIEKIPGLTTRVVEVKFDFDSRISSSVNSHTH